MPEAEIKQARAKLMELMSLKPRALEKLKNLRPPTTEQIGESVK